MVTEGDLMLGSEHAMQYSDSMLLNCILVTYIILLTSVTPVNLVNGKKNLKGGERTNDTQMVNYGNQDLQNKGAGCGRGSALSVAGAVFIGG